MTTRRSASTSCAARSRPRPARSPRTPARTAPWSWARSSDKDDYAFGFNAATGEYGNLVKQGVIDPAKVVRNALQDAASVAGLLITTEAMVAEKPKKKGPANASGRRHGRHGLLGIIRKSGTGFPKR